MGLKKDSSFYEELLMTPHKFMDEAKSRAQTFIRLEKDKDIKKSGPTRQVPMTILT